MLVWSRTIRIFAVALLVGALAAPIVGGWHDAQAQASGGKYIDPSDPNATGDPTAGDPDGPTGDVPPPTSTEIGSGSGALAGSAGTTGSVQNDPVGSADAGRRYGMWAHWRVTLKLFLRHVFLR